MSVRVHAASDDVELPDTELDALWLGPSSTGFLGVFVQPASIYCGLRPWDDAPEGHAPKPWTLFDVEKFARMLLRQSVAAFETLVVASSAQLELRTDVATWALTQEMPINLCAAAQGCRIQNDLENAMQYAAMARLLAQHGLACGASALAEAGVIGLSENEQIVFVQGTQAVIAINNVLPPTPTGYDQLNDWVIRARLGTL